MTVSAIAEMTRGDAALRSMARAADRLRRLELEADAAFAEYLAAQESLAQEGISCDVELGVGMATALSEWKRHRAADRGREIGAAV